MKGQLNKLALLTLLLLVALAGTTSGSERWTAPFETGAAAGIDDSALTLRAALNLVAARNPLLPSLILRAEAARGRIVQAGVRPNPELVAAIEEVGWDAPGFNQSEFTVSVSQEFELFGRRDARKGLAEADWQATEFDARVAAFDLYLETKDRFYRLAHAQERSHLSDISIKLAEDVVETIRERIDKGAALQSELLLARLELQRARLASGEARLEIETAQVSLALMWGSGFAEVEVVAPVEPDFEAALSRITASIADSSRTLLALDRHRERLNARRRLAIAEVKPTLTLSCGYKRLAADRTNTLVFGLALPLPFRNQNSGTLLSLDAEIRQIDLERKLARLEGTAAVASGLAHLRQLINRHTALDDELLPTVEEAHRTIQTLYQSGRLPYTNLLEANRSLVELRFEHNDILLALREQVIGLERTAGLILQTDEDSYND